MRFNQILRYSSLVIRMWRVYYFWSQRHSRNSLNASQSWWEVSWPEYNELKVLVDSFLTFPFRIRIYFWAQVRHFWIFHWISAEIWKWRASRQLNPMKRETSPTAKFDNKFTTCTSWASWQLAFQDPQRNEAVDRSAHAVPARRSPGARIEVCAFVLHFLGSWLQLWHCGHRPGAQQRRGLRRRVPRHNVSPVRVKWDTKQEIWNIPAIAPTFTGRPINPQAPATSKRAACHRVTRCQ